MYQLRFLCFNMSSRSYLRIVKKSSVLIWTRLKLNFFILFFSNIIFPSFCNENINQIVINPDLLPVIQNLSHTDLTYRQYIQTVDHNNKIASRPEHDFSDYLEEYYAYTVKKGEDLLSIHASTGIPYDTISTLNSISDTSEVITNKRIILPTIKGIYQELNPSNTIQILITKENSDFANSLSQCYNVNNHKFIFFPGKRFTSLQRAFFLDSGMGLPLDSIQVTSEFGYRTSPISGTWKFHKGVDFRAKIGTQVYACKGGVVTTCVKNDPIFGNYIILSHPNGITSVYAHLSKIMVTKNQVVQKGNVIGLVGQTGAATGPHLHFEIRQNGIATDPKFIYDR